MGSARNQGGKKRGGKKEPRSREKIKREGEITAPQNRTPGGYRNRLTEKKLAVPSQLKSARCTFKVLEERRGGAIED